ncbi:MAG: acyl-phosphate glycerol 3-phosphate acyltransferase [Magnetovibrio sp.]|nr:acyl-phosphate glycerol 3-phosphate acyltransferase [Magnetovibrio sp.]
MTLLNLELYIVYGAFFGYLLGSVSFGLLLTHLAGLNDLRETGSGNIGATNVLRTGHKTLAMLTLIGDSGKGVAAAVLAGYFWDFNTALIAGFMAVLGHNFPIWLKFKGGKGVATSFGVLIYTAWPVGLSACATWLLVACMFRYSSLAALIALSAAPIYAYFLMDLEQIMWQTIGLAILAIARHKDNITRLIKGEESKIGRN